MHQPGAQTVLGRSYPDGGFEQGRAVLATLARHPATAKHLARKLARHFVADEPPPALVERLAKRFVETQGDLKEMAKALVTAPEAWDTPRNKLKRPGEWIIGALRATGVTPPDIGPVMQAHNLLGEPLWRPPGAQGLSPTTARPGSTASRSASTSPIPSPAASAARSTRERCSKQVLAPLASATKRGRQSLRAESRPQALALLLMAPEFQRR